MVRDFARRGDAVRFAWNEPLSRPSPCTTIGPGLSIIRESQRHPLQSRVRAQKREAADAFRGFPAQPLFRLGPMVMSRRRRDARGHLQSQRRPALSRLEGIPTFAVLGQIQPHGFVFLGNPQTHGRIQNLQENQSHHKGVHPGDNNTQRLHAQLPRVAEE
jgi:hypothetical protein